MPCSRKSGITDPQQTALCRDWSGDALSRIMWLEMWLDVTYVRSKVQKKKHGHTFAQKPT